ncbi:MAG: hypothetical protein ACOYM7_07990, partial [Paludibacter sp.]
KNLKEVKSVLNIFVPVNTFHSVGSNNTLINNAYRIDIKNDYYERNLKISFSIENGFKVQIEILFDNIENGFVDAFFNLGSRRLYDNETVYVNIPAHFKKFKDIKIFAYYFKGVTASDVINWYGCNKTLLNSEIINNIINALNN